MKNPMDYSDKSFWAFCFKTPFGALFALAFAYMGALGFALEGQLTASRICGGIGMAILLICCVISVTQLVREYRAASSTDES